MYYVYFKVYMKKNTDSTAAVIKFCLTFIRSIKNKPTNVSKMAINATNAINTRVGSGTARRMLSSISNGLYSFDIPDVTNTATKI